MTNARFTSEVVKSTLEVPPAFKILNIIEFKSTNLKIELRINPNNEANTTEITGNGALNLNRPNNSLKIIIPKTPRVNKTPKLLLLNLPSSAKGTPNEINQVQ